MRWVIGAELAITVLGGLAFMLAYAQGRWWVTSTGRMVMAWTAVGVVEGATLLAAVLGIVLPMVLFALGFASVDLVVAWRLVELWHVRRGERRPSADS